MLSWCVHAVKFKRKIKQPQLTSDNEHNTQIILKTADLSYTHLSTLGGTDFQNKYPLLIYVFNIKCYLSSAFQSTYLSPTFLQQATESRLVVATILPPFFQKLHGLLFFLLCVKISVRKSTQRVEVAIGKIRMPEQTLQPLFYCICLLCMCVCVPNPFGQTSLSGFHTNMDIWEL